MKLHNHRIVRSVSLLALAAGAAMTLASAAGAGQGAPQNATASGGVSASRSITTASSGGNTVRVESDNGKFTITHNGKQLSHGAITDKTWKTFEVTDENGDKIAEITRNGDQFDIRMSDDPMEEWVATGDAANLAALEIQLQQGTAGAPRAFARLTNANPPRTMLGVNLENPSEALAAHLGVNRETSTLLTNVSEGFPADKAGLRKFDIITEVDGQPAAPETLRKALREKNPGDTLTLKIIRGTERKDVSVTLEAYDSNRLGGNLSQFGAANAWNAQAPGAFTFFGSADAERWEEQARAMEKLASELEARARDAAEQAGKTQSRALEDLNRQMEEISRQLAEKAEQMAQEGGTRGLGSTNQAFRILGRGRSGQGVPFVAPLPAAPVTPLAPSGQSTLAPAPSTPEVDHLRQRMDAIDQRLASLTALLEKAIAEKGASAPGGTAKNN